MRLLTLCSENAGPLCTLLLLALQVSTLVPAAARHDYWQFKERRPSQYFDASWLKDAQVTRFF